MQPLTGSQRQIVTDPELGCNKDCWRQNPDGSTKFDHEPAINYLYPLRRREFMAESRQRYQDAVARALANQPGLILADEPTGSLDQESGARVLDLLVRLLNESGTTLVLVTHDEGVATRADRVIRMLDGRISS